MRWSTPSRIDTTPPTHDRDAHPRTQQIHHAGTECQMRLWTGGSEVWKADSLRGGEINVQGTDLFSPDRGGKNQYLCKKKKNEETRELTPLTFVFDDVGNTLYPRHCLLLEKDTWCGGGVLDTRKWAWNGSSLCWNGLKRWHLHCRHTFLVDDDDA